MIGDYFRKRAARAARRRGNHARDAGRWAEAVADYRRYLGFVPDDVAIRIQLGHMLSQTGDADAADGAYRSAWEQDPGDGDLLLCWGHARKRAGDIERARELYRLSHAADGNKDAVRELGELEPVEVPIPAPDAGRVPETGQRAAWAARIETVKPFRPAPDAEMAVLVTHSHTGAIKPHVLPYVEALAAHGIAVLLIAVTDREVSLKPALLDAVAGAVIRENAGYDFAGWAHAIHLFPELYGAATLYLLNDSVIAEPRRLAATIARVRASEADLIGLTESHEYRWHLQTYFLALKPRLLSSWRLHGFFSDVRIHGDKDAVIRAYETAFAPLIEDSGHRIETLFPSPVALNPTLHGWRRLIDDDFPFVKALLVRGAFAECDTTGWRPLLAEAGFDIDLIEEVIEAGGQDVPREHTDRLSAHPIAWDDGGGRPLKVAFYGPWNYDNGLGAASRGIIAAIGRANVRLNLHPIKQPFHIHKPLTPPVDIVDFEGHPDIAIVHLNPDSWFLLTGEQRDAIRRARKRIGYWVWEMGHIPPAWRHDFSSVDRIWAPSNYCAELFAAQGEARVDVIPHAVTVLPKTATDRAGMMAEHGIPADRRILLYLFDGSSYLVRKNPAALVRAFSAAGLADRGWSLVLKTKHLMDRADEGAAFKALTEATPGCVLIDRTLPDSAVQALLQAADLYASPHCSEGFGLTIAEAMAAGKPVVATDFGGSADFLDSATGYPVKAHAWRLDEDFGHYTKGGEWARIDEPALVATLLRAAKAVEAGDTTIGAAARARIGEMLSYDAVGRRIAASFDDVLHGPGAGPKVEPVPVNRDRGLTVETGRLDDVIRVVALRPDGAPGAVPDLSPEDWVVLAPAGSRLAPHFADRLRDWAARRRDVGLFYADDVAGEADPAIDQLRLKPELDLTLLAAQDYVGGPVAVRADVLARLGGLDVGDRTATVAGLLFRAAAAGVSIARIPEVLLAHPGKRVAATAKDYRAMLEVQPQLAGCDIVAGRGGGFAQIRRFDDPPPVTIVVPTRRSILPSGEGLYVERLLDALSAVDWPMEKLTVLVGDDVEADWPERSVPFALRRIATPRAEGAPFNYAAKMNRLWRHAETEHLVLLNDDAQPTGPGWLKALMTFAVDPGVGGVGARLLFDDGRLQHAGMAPHGQGLAHSWIFRAAADGTYQDWARTQREWSAVTGAVFATRASVLEQVGGFDERFALEFNDVDLCLRMRAAGYRIVYTPLAELVHTEKASRGQTLPAGDQMALFLSRWRQWLAADPSWHPRLRRDRIDVTPDPEPDAWYR